MGRFPTYESRGVPNVGSAPRINASAFGAPGRALAQLGHTLSSIEAHQKTRADQNALFKAQTDLNNADAEAYKQLQQNIQDTNDGSEIFKRTISPYDDQVKQIQEKLPEHLRPRFGSIASRSRESLSNRTVSAQVSAQRNYYTNNINKYSQQSQTIVEANPDAFAEELKRTEDYIDSSGLDGVTKDNLRQKHLSDLEYAHVRGRFNRKDDINQILKDTNKKPNASRNTFVKIYDYQSKNRLKLPNRKDIIQGIIIHHTAGSSLDGALETSLKNKNGAHYYLDRDGRTYKWADDGKRIAHIQNHGSSHRTDKGKFAHLSNDSTIGIEVVSPDSKSFTPAQKEALAGLLYQLSKQHGIKRENVLGHGEIQGGQAYLGPDGKRYQGNRRPTEGTEFAQLHRNRRDHMDGGVDTQTGDSGFRYQYLTDQQRNQIRREAKTALSGQRYDAEQELKDDIASIRKTGKSAEGVDYSTAERVLPSDKYAKYNLQRKQAAQEFAAYDGIDQLNTGDLQKRLNSVKPKDGQKGFEFKQKLHDNLRKDIEKLEKLRITDPAKSVETVRNVKDAQSKVTYSRPETIQKLVRERYIAQQEIGLPESSWAGITKQEAEAIMSPMFRADPEQVPDIIEKVARKVKEVYGPYSERIMNEAIRFAIKNKDDRAIAIQTFKDISDTGTTTTKNANDAAAVKEADSKKNAVNNQSSLSLQLEEDAALELREQLAGGAQLPKPNDAQKEALRRNPEKYQEFIQKFGADEAEKILRGN